MTNLKIELMTFLILVALFSTILPSSDFSDSFRNLQLPRQYLVFLTI